MIKTIGEPHVFGVQKLKPLRGFPDGKVRIKMRNTAFAQIYIRTPEGIRQFVAKDCGDFWQCSHEQGRNERRKCDVTSLDLVTVAKWKLVAENRQALADAIEAVETKLKAIELDPKPF